MWLLEVLDLVCAPCRCELDVTSAVVLPVAQICATSCSVQGPLLGQSRVGQTVGNRTTKDVHLRAQHAVEPNRADVVRTKVCP